MANPIDEYLIDSDVAEYLQVFLSDHKKWLDQESGGRQADLSRMQLDGIDLSGALLRKSLMVGVQMNRGVLENCDLSESDLFGAALANANLQSANLSNATLRGVTLRGTNLTNADLSDADFRGGFIMTPENGTAYDWENSDLSECMMNYATGRRAKMSNVDLSRASMVGANLQGALLFGSNLSGVDLSFADLREADLRETDLSDANLNDSDLRGANLSNAVVQNTLMRAAKLQDTDFDGVDLSGCDLNDDPAIVTVQNLPAPFKRSSPRTRNGCAQTAARAAAAFSMARTWPIATCPGATFRAFRSRTPSCWARSFAAPSWFSRT